MPNGRRMGSHGTLLISENVRTNRQSTSAEAPRLEFDEIGDRCRTG